MLLSTNSDLLPRSATLQLRLKQDPSFVLGLEIPTARDDRDCLHNLPSPEFDETGFIGRGTEISLLKKHLAGPYPVISIVGEGGLGKTALALKVAYDTLDDPACAYDAIVWASSKSSFLTHTEVRDIANEVRDSLGLLTIAADTLAGNVADPFAEVLEYLQVYRILLILDNLETVVDSKLLHFLENLPSGSKVLLTSRVGLQSLELPVRLKAMSKDESVQLLRALAAIRGTEQLTRMNNKGLYAYCERLHHNPLFIKWFVSTVQHGSRPEESLSNQHVPLDFCMSNVFKHLTPDSKTLLRVLQVTGSPQSVVQLAFLSDIDGASVRAALLQLESSNMLITRSKPIDGTFHTDYDLQALSRAFLSKHYPVPEADFDSIHKRKRQLAADLEQLREPNDNVTFSATRIDVRNDSERIVAGLLRRAVMAGKGPTTAANAEHLISRAKALCPDFFEIHRVNAWILAKQRRMGEARGEYETAISIRGDYAPLRFFFGQFLLRIDDIDGAEQQFKEALRLSPDAVSVRVELCRVSLYHRNFGASRAQIDELLKVPKLGENYKRQLIDLRIQSFVREAEAERTQRNPNGALVCLESAKAFYGLLDISLIDSKIVEHVLKGSPTVSWCWTQFSEPSMQERVREILNWLTEIRSMSQFDRTSDSDIDELQISQQRRGVFKSKGEKLSYGDIELGANIQPSRIFVHRSELRTGRWEALRSGTWLSFTVGMNQGKLCALNVQVVAGPSPVTGSTIDPRTP